MWCFSTSCGARHRFFMYAIYAAAFRRASFLRELSRSLGRNMYGVVVGSFKHCSAFSPYLWGLSFGLSLFSLSRCAVFSRSHASYVDFHSASHVLSYFWSIENCSRLVALPKQFFAKLFHSSDSVKNDDRVLAECSRARLFQISRRERLRTLCRKSYFPSSCGAAKTS